MAFFRLATSEVIDISAAEQQKLEAQGDTSESQHEDADTGFETTNSSGLTPIAAT